MLLRLWLLSEVEVLGKNKVLTLQTTRDFSLSLEMTA